MVRRQSFLADLDWSPELQAAAIIAASFVVAKVVDWLVSALARRVVRRTRTEVDDKILAVLHGPIVKSVVLFGLYWAALVLLPDEDGDPHRYLAFTKRALLTIVALLWMAVGLRLSGTVLREASRLENRFVALEERTFPLFHNLAKVMLVAAGTYGVIVIWGWNPSGWLASAGIVGLAMGLAAQDTLSNLFAGVSIIADAPYGVGDFINLESGERGQVVNIGLRSTRLLTREDIEITIPNSVMGRARITNETAGESSKRRVSVSVGVAYGSDVAQVERVLIRVAAANEEVCLDPEPRVRFRSFGDSGLNIDLLCWIPRPVLRGLVLHQLNTAVYEGFAAEGIEIPFPQRDVHVREMPKTPPAPAEGA